MKKLGEGEFSWFGATGATITCLHCGKTGHLKQFCPELEANKLSVLDKPVKKAKKAKKAAEKTEKAASDNQSETTVADSEAGEKEERKYQFGHLGEDSKGKKIRNSKDGVPDRLAHAFGAGDLYVGDADCGQKLLEKLGITCIVNAAPVGAQAPKYKGMEHFRFPISDLLHLRGDFDVTTPAGAARALNPLMEFIESRTQQGHNVLIQED